MNIRMIIALLFLLAAVFLPRDGLAAKEDASAHEYDRIQDRRGIWGVWADKYRHIAGWEVFWRQVSKLNPNINPRAMKKGQKFSIPGTLAAKRETGERTADAKKHNAPSNEPAIVLCKGNPQGLSLKQSYYGTSFDSVSMTLSEYRSFAARCPSGMLPAGNVYISGKPIPSDLQKIRKGVYAFRGRAAYGFRYQERRVSETDPAVSPGVYWLYRSTAFYRGWLSPAELESSIRSLNGMKPEDSFKDGAMYYAPAPAELYLKAPSGFSENLFVEVPGVAGAYMVNTAYAANPAPDRAKIGEKLSGGTG